MLQAILFNSRCEDVGAKRSRCVVLLLFSTVRKTTMCSRWPLWRSSEELLLLLSLKTELKACDCPAFFNVLNHTEQVAFLV